MKILGLRLDSKLNFDNHISNICQKAGKQIQVLSRLGNILNESNKMLLYNSFIECYFNYCSIIWHFCSHHNTYKLEKLQKKQFSSYSAMSFPCKPISFAEREGSGKKQCFKA